MRDRMIDMIKTAVTCEDLTRLEVLKNAGADEVILALQNGSFSALRQFASDEIIRVSETVHAMGMEVSVLMNRLFPQPEADSFQNQMLWLLEEGIDRNKRKAEEFELFRFAISLGIIYISSPIILNSKFSERNIQLF